MSAYGQFGSLDANAWAIVQIFKNGANVQGGNFQRISSASGIGSTASVIIDANGTTDYFEVYVYHGGSSGAKNIDLVQFSGALVGGGGSDTLSGLSCTDGQVAAWNDVAGQWACTDMASGGSGGSGQDVSFHVHKNGTAQTVSASTFTKLTWGTETFDTNDNFASDRFTPTVAGKYLITLSTACGTSSTNCQPHIYKNGAAYARSVQTGSASTITNSVTAIVDMNGTTDYVEGYIFTAQTSVLGTVTDTFFSGALFGGGGSGGGSAAQDVSFSASTGTVTTGADPRAANFTTEEFDTTNAFDLTTDQFTPQTPGKYIITLWAQGQTIPDGEALVCYIYKNGASVANQINRQSSANNNLTCSVSQVVDMNGSTDYVAGFVYDSNGAVAAARITGALIGGGGGGGGSDTLAGLSCTSGQVAAWDGSAWACEDMGAGGGSGGSTMVEDWPDAIQCTAGAVTMILYAGNMPDSDGRFYYGEPWSTGSSYYIGFNADGTYASQVTRDYTDCKTSITAIKADGRAFNFVGGGGGSGSGFTCPAGFTKIESQGQTLGCMQTNENGSGVSWETATNTCYTAHGGRLPSSSEWYIAMNNYTLTAENDDSEWNNDQTGDNEHSISGTAATNSSFNGDSNTGNAYRCFIPAGANGGGSGSGDSVWTDSGNGYLEYAGTDMGVKLQNITGMDQPAIGLTSGMTWDEATSTLSVDGNITYTGTLTDTSDRRLKTDIESLVKYGSMLDKINAIDTYSFRMKDTPEAGKEFGVMAQELEEIFPELVHTANDEMGTKSVNYVGLIAPMIEATKELSAENAVLKAELEALRADRASVRADVDSLKEQVALLNKLAADDAEKASSLTLWLALMAVLSMTGLFGFIVVRRRKA
ncbi:MAG: tail fiber domain-containing protein [Alphaproteobacteria bacterium]|nr:tail fiber domain-containing protein [Alphaproteobacteria bacterium]